MNRFYRQSAPRYTSQFVEEQLPLDLMLGFAQQKQQQQSAFAESVGTLQGLAATLPNGLRTEEMAPIVRQRWDKTISDWSSKNMSNYDSPNAIAELSKLHSMFQADPDVNIMKKDAKDSESYMQMKLKSGVSDIDPNLEDPTSGRLWQFSPSENGRPAIYSPYQPIIADPDSTKRITEEFGIIKPQETTESYMRKEVVNGQEMWREGRRSVSRTPSDLYGQKLENMTQRGIENKEPWAVYENAKYRQQYGRNMNADEWKQFINDRGQSTIRRDYADNANWQIPSGGSGSGSDKDQMGLGTLYTDVADKPEGYNDITMKLFRQIKHASSDKNFNIANYPEIYNLHQAFSNDDAYKDLKSWRERFNYMKKAYVKPSTQTKMYSGWDSLQEKDELSINGTLMGRVDKEGLIKTPFAGTAFKGQPIYDFYEGRQLQESDKKNLAEEGSTVRVLGRVTDKLIGRAPAPGMIMLEKRKGDKENMYMMQIPDFVEEDRLTWDTHSYMRTNSGIGDGFVADFRYREDGAAGNPVITDTQNSRIPADQLSADSPTSLYIQPMQDFSDGGREKIKVYTQNPHLHYKDNSKMPIGEALFNNQANELFVGEYNISDYSNTGEMWQKIIDDANPIKNQNSLLNQKNQRMSIR